MQGGLFIICLGGIIVCGAYIGAHFIIKRLGGIDTIESTKEGNIKIHLGRRGENWTIVDVPANVFGVPSGVCLEEDKEITITASGAIITDAESYFKSPRKSHEFQERVIGWRGPDGARLNYKDEKSEEKTKKAEESDKLKLIKLKRGKDGKKDGKYDAEYGFLLGIVSLNENEKEDEGFLKNIDKLIADGTAAVFKIGEKAVIKFDDRGKKFIIKIKKKDSVVELDDLDKKFAGHKIYLIVNDCVVKSEDDLRKVNCADPLFANVQKMCMKEDIKNLSGEPFKDLISQIKIYHGLYKGEKGNHKAIWYTDNMGHFSVLVKTEPPGIFH